MGLSRKHKASNLSVRSTNKIKLERQMRMRSQRPKYHAKNFALISEEKEKH